MTSLIVAVAESHVVRYYWEILRTNLRINVDIVNVFLGLIADRNRHMCATGGVA